MGTLRGFLDFNRKEFAMISVTERVANYDEFIIMPDDLEMKKQAARCMACDIPYCHALGCPLGSRISEWSDAVLRGNLDQAYDSLIRTNGFPELSGRVCPALCECACTLAIDLAPVNIRQIELYIIEKAFAAGLVQPNKASVSKCKRVAVIGSGPAGLAAADALQTLGYDVTVYEKSDSIGGLLRHGIPNYKLPKSVLDRRIALMEQAGIRFVTSINVGSEYGATWLRREHDAILLCMGAGIPRDLSLEQRTLDGIHFAVPFLTGANQVAVGKQALDDVINARDKQVLVIGGGDTGSDCIGMAIRQGAKLVTQIEILPKPQVWSKPFNPAWPSYPAILRTSSAHKEGCIREFSVTTTAFIAQDGHVSAAHCKRVEWFKDANNRDRMEEIPGSDFIIPADLVLLAMGFLHVEQDTWLSELGVDFGERGQINVVENYQTRSPGVFVAGDAATGASLVCKCINEGRQAAKAIDAYLS
jgi:glutamate synthase (NADPH/NADH) small chain